MEGKIDEREVIIQAKTEGKNPIVIEVRKMSTGDQTMEKEGRRWVGKIIVEIIKGKDQIIEEHRVKENQQRIRCTEEMIRQGFRERVSLIQINLTQEVD